MNRALVLLSGRALSINELKEKLKRRATTPSDVDRVIFKLKEAGYLNDGKLAESFAAARIENQSFGRMRVLRDLRGRRVAPDIAQKAVSEAFRDVDEPSLIERFLERKYRGKDLGVLLQDERELASAYRKLHGAGFGTANAIKVLKRHAAKAELLEDQPEEPEDEEDNGERQ